MTERLSSIEAERIISIIEDTIEKLNFLDRITPDVLQHRDELSKFIGDEISRVMTEQKALEKRYEELVELRSSMKGSVNKSRYKEVQEEIQDVSRALRESTNNLVRSLKENPNVSGNLIKVQRDRTELSDLLLRACQELRDRGGQYANITSKVDEENNSRKRFQALKLREKELRESVSRLELQLSDEQAMFQKTVMDQKLAISQLKEELSTQKGSASMDAKFKRKESLAHVSAIWREFKMKERLLEDKVNMLEDKIQTEKIVHVDSKDFLIRKNQSLAEEAASWDTKFERDAADLDSKIDQFKKKRIALLSRLSVLQKRKEVETEEAFRNAERVAQELKEKKAKEADDKLRNAAARRLQRSIRSYIQRKREAEAKKGDGKKKKGGGKGKKK